MRIRDVGSLIVEVDGDRTELGTTKQAALLSRLVIDANRRVSAEALASAAWRADSEKSLSSLDSQLWRLRNVLEPDRGRSSSVLVREGGGYRLLVADGDVDSLLFGHMFRGIESAVRAGDLQAGMALIDEALELWRGTPYEVLEEDAGATAARARLEQERDQLGEWRIDALLGLGHPEQALSDLAPLITRSPFRERLWWQRMMAMAKVGRTEEALATFQRVRQLLVDEVGMEPGPELRRLQGRILAADPDLEATWQVAVVPPRLPPATTPREASIRLPRRGTDLLGREHDRGRLAALIVEQPLVTVTGAGGSGKTRLAVEVAATSTDAFPDGVWFVDLGAVHDPDLAVDVVVTTMALGASQTVDPLQALVEFARGRRFLVVLDNCEHVLDGAAAVVEHLLLAGEDRNGPGPAVLATSREPLGVDGEHIWSVAPLSLLPVGSADALAPASQLFVDRARAAAPGLALDDDDLAVVEQICRSLDGLPLAIELAAARVRSLTLREIAGQVRADPSRLARIGRSRGDHRQSLYDAIEWSYRLLTPEEQTLHRRLSVLPGAFTVSAAVGVAGETFADESTVADALLGLAHRSLLSVNQPTAPRSGSSFFQLETVRSHAYRRCVAVGELTDGLQRRDRWVAALLARRPRLGRPEAPAWYDELEDSYPTIRAALQRAVGPEGLTELVDLGSGLGYFWYFRSRMIEGCRWLEAAQAAGHQPAGGVEDIATRLRLAGADMLRFRPDLARPHLDAVLGRIEALPPGSQVVVAEALVSAAGGAWACQAFDLVMTLRDALTRLAASVDDEPVRLFADVIDCVASLPRGRLVETGARAEALFTRSVEVDNLLVGWVAALVRCVVATETVNPADALAWTQRVVDLHERLGRGGSKVFLEALGNCFVLTEDYARAVQLYSAARMHARQAGSGWPEHPRTRELYARSRSVLATKDFEQAWRDGEQLSLQDLAAWTADPAPKPM